MLILDKTKGTCASLFNSNKTQTNLVDLFLTTGDIDMPRRAFDDIKGADVTFLEIILQAEPPPTLCKQIPSILAWTTM